MFVLATATIYVLAGNGLVFDIGGSNALYLALAAATTIFLPVASVSLWQKLLLICLLASALEEAAALFLALLVAAPTNTLTSGIL